MKPSTLIQILTDGGIEGSQAAVVGVILTSLRCDKCVHWLPTGWLTKDMFCGHLYTDGVEQEIARVSTNEDGFVITKPYFFCAMWEKKDA